MIHIQTWNFQYTALLSVCVCALTVFWYRTSFEIKLNPPESSHNHPDYLCAARIEHIHTYISLEFISAFFLQTTSTYMFVLINSVTILYQLGRGSVEPSNIWSGTLAVLGIKWGSKMQLQWRFRRFWGPPNVEGLAALHLFKMTVLVRAHIKMAFRNKNACAF